MQSVDRETNSVIESLLHHLFQKFTCQNSKYCQIIEKYIQRRVILSRNLSKNEQTTQNLFIKFDIREQQSYLKFVFRAKQNSSNIQKHDYLLHPYHQPSCLHSY